MVALPHLEVGEGSRNALLLGKEDLPCAQSLGKLLWVDVVWNRQQHRLLSPSAVTITVLANILPGTCSVAYTFWVVIALAWCWDWKGTAF